MGGAIPVGSTSSSSHSLPRHLNWFEQSGWALRVRKASNAIHPSVKEFIQQVLVEEKRYGRKTPNEEYVKRIRTARHSDGTKMFQINQYLTLSQVTDSRSSLYTIPSWTSRLILRYKIRFEHCRRSPSRWTADQRRGCNHLLWKWAPKCFSCMNQMNISRLWLWPMQAPSPDHNEQSARNQSRLLTWISPTRITAIWTTTISRPLQRLN